MLLLNCHLTVWLPYVGVSEQLSYCVALFIVSRVRRGLVVSLLGCYPEVGVQIPTWAEILFGI